MSLWKDLGKAAKTVFGAVNPIAGSMFAADDENKALRKQVDEYNKNLDRQAAKVHNLAASEGIGQQAAYNWASNMIRKHRDNPAALESVTGIAANKLQSSSDRAAQLRAAAIEMVAKRMVKPEKLTPAQLAMTGWKTGIEAATAITNIVGLAKGITIPQSGLSEPISILDSKYIDQPTYWA